MAPTQELIDSIHRERLMRARQTSGSERMMQGALLFDYGVEAMMAGLRMSRPNATEAELLPLIRERLARQRRREAQ